MQCRHAGLAQLKPAEAVALGNRLVGNTHLCPPTYLTSLPLLLLPRLEKEMGAEKKRNHGGEGSDDLEQWSPNLQ